MLSNLSLETARVLAEELNRRRIAVQPLEESQVADLVEAGEPFLHGDEPTTVADAVTSLARTTVVDPLDGGVTHDDVMDNIVDKIAGLMNRRLTLARTVINPLTDKYSDLMVEALSALVPQSPEIKEIAFSQFYDNPLARGIFEGYGYRGADALTTMKGIAFNDENNYHFNAFTTGNHTLDEELQRIRDVRGDDWVKEITSRYFVQGDVLNIEQPSLTEKYLEVLDSNLVTHAMAHYLYGNQHIPTNMSTGDYEGKLLEILGRTSQNINGLYKYRTDLDTRGIVTDKVVLEGYSISVYAPNYAKYKANGGSDTALMGHARGGYGKLGLTQLIANKTALESVYDKEVNDGIQELRSKQFVNLRNTALRCLPQVIDGIPQEVISTIQPLIMAGVDSREELMRRGQEYINTATGIDVSNPYAYALKIITIGLLPELELSQLYSTMEAYLTPAVGAPQLTPKQAVYYAVLDELVTFFLSQTSLSDTK